jgi:hypothetical protein
MACVEGGDAQVGGDDGITGSLWLDLPMVVEDRYCELSGQLELNNRTGGNEAARTQKSGMIESVVSPSILPRSTFDPLCSILDQPRVPEGAADVFVTQLHETIPLLWFSHLTSARRRWREICKTQTRQGMNYRVHWNGAFRTPLWFKP